MHGKQYFIYTQYMNAYIGIASLYEAIAWYLIVVLIPLDNILSIALLWLFIRRLYQLIKQRMTTEISVSGSNTTPKAGTDLVQENISLIKVMTRLCLLVSIIVISSFVILSIATALQIVFESYKNIRYYTAILQIMDLLVNNTCLLLSFGSFNKVQKFYNCICMPMDVCCQKCCKKCVMYCVNKNINEIMLEQTVSNNSSNSPTV